VSTLFKSNHGRISAVCDDQYSSTLATPVLKDRCGIALRRVDGQVKIQNQDFAVQIRSCDGREREKRQQIGCGLASGRGGGTRHRSALAARADADLALWRVESIQMENKRKHIWGRDYRCLQALVCCPAFLLMPKSPVVWIGNHRLFQLGKPHNAPTLRKYTQTREFFQRRQSRSVPWLFTMGGNPGFESWLVLQRRILTRLPKNIKYLTLSASFVTDFQTLAWVQLLSGILYFELWHHSQHLHQ
jgi:hypothetical protein